MVLHWNLPMRKLSSFEPECFQFTGTSNFMWTLFSKKKPHHSRPWNSNKQAPRKMIVSWLNIYTINSCMWGRILCRNTVWSSPCLAIRKLMGVLLCEFLSGRAQRYLPKINTYECEITPWFCAHLWQICTVPQCFRILCIYSDVGLFCGTNES